MSLGRTLRASRHTLAGLLAIIAVVLLSTSSFAQSDSNPKWDLFAGYQWMHPGITVPAAYGDPNNPTPYKVPDMAKGFGTSITYNFDSHWGLEADFGENWSHGNSEFTASVGPRFIWRTDVGNYFAHTLLGDNWLPISGLNKGANNIGAVLGGGMDLPITKLISFRLFEADYIWSRHNYSDYVGPQFPNLRRTSMEGVRLRTGVVFSWGGAAPVLPAAACSIQPAEVMIGEPLTATVAASNFNPKHTVTYSWSGNGGTVTGKETTATIDTTNAAPGSYTVSAHVTDPKSKNNNEASCSANYTVKPLPPKNPPTLSISANPSSIITGGTINLSASCSSPDGVPVSVANWTSTAGTISGSGSSATLGTNGLAPSSVTINATCTDSRGLSAQATTQVSVLANPEIHELEVRLALHSIYFATARPTPQNPTGGLVPSQEQTLTVLAADFQKYLQSKPDARLILAGHADKRGTEEFNQKLSERRVERVKSFLVEHGVPASSIDTKALGKNDNLTAEQVKDAVDNNPELTPEERARVLKNTQVIIWASNRRVDITLSTTGQTSVRQFPFNSTDSLTLIGGREAEAKAAKKPAAKKKAPVKKQ